METCDCSRVGNTGCVGDYSGGKDREYNDGVDVLTGVSIDGQFSAQSSCGGGCHSPQGRVRRPNWGRMTGSRGRRLLSATGSCQDRCGEADSVSGTAGAAGTRAPSGCGREDATPLKEEFDTSRINHSVTELYSMSGYPITLEQQQCRHAPTLEKELGCIELVAQVS